MPTDVETFCRACWQHDEKTIAKLASRVDPNGKDKWNHTPLLMAAQYADLTLVELLVKRGATVDQQRKHLTPITYAAERGATEVVDFLRENRATPSIVTWIYLGDKKRVAAELKRDPAQATLRDEEETPILHHAAESLRPEMVTLLLERGATIDDVDANKETALHRVADMRNADQQAAREMTTLLLNRGAAVNASNWDDVTPLHQAVRARNLAAVEVLLARGADANARDKSRHSTPLRRAVSSSGAGGTAGTTDLMVALTRLLLQHGADPDARDKRGVTIRASAKSPEVIAVLKSHRKM